MIILLLLIGFSVQQNTNLRFIKLKSRASLPSKLADRLSAASIEFANMGSAFSVKKEIQAEIEGGVLKVSKLDIPSTGIADLEIKGMKRNGDPVSFSVTYFKMDNVFSPEKEPQTGEDKEVDCSVYSNGITKKLDKTAWTSQIRSIANFQQASFFLDQGNNVNVIDVQGALTYTNMFDIEGNTYPEGFKAKISRVDRVMKVKGESTLVIESEDSLHFLEVTGKTATFYFSMAKTLTNEEQVTGVAASSEGYVLMLKDKFMVVKPNTAKNSDQFNDATDWTVLETVKKTDLLDFVVQSGFLFGITKTGLFVHDLAENKEISQFSHPNLKTVNLTRNYATGLKVLSVQVEQDLTQEIPEYLIEFFIASKGKLLFNKAFGADDKIAIDKFVSSPDFSTLFDVEGHRVLILRNGVFHQIDQQIYEQTLPNDLKKEEVFVSPVDGDGLDLVLLYVNGAELVKEYEFTYEGEGLKCDPSESGEYEVSLQALSDECAEKNGQTEYCSYEITVRGTVEGETIKTDRLLVSLGFMLIILVIVFVFFFACRKAKKPETPRRFDTVDRADSQKENSIQIEVTDN